MKRVHIYQSYNIKCNESYEAIPLEIELEKATREKTPIISISPELFSSRKDGIRPDTDIRTDKWDIAHAAMDKVSQARVAKLEGKTNNEEQKSEKVIDNNTSNAASPTGTNGNK